MKPDQSFKLSPLELPEAPFMPTKLENRIPPPLVLAFCLAMVWFTKHVYDYQQLPREELRLWAIPYALMGIAIILLAVMRFARFKTTVNPLNPESASHLVRDGIFAYTRNPMYLGMALILFSAILAIGHMIALMWLLFFVLYIQRFQIGPEERAIRDKFGEEYDVYCEQVRPWL